MTEEEKNEIRLKMLNRDIDIPVFATAFLKLWLQDRCPSIDKEWYEMMLEVVDPLLKDECIRRKKQWEQH